jgi:PBP1b-binding outer membrane lipoprotein LpoB
MSFTSVIEDIQVLDFEDKIKVQFLLNKYLVEEKRERIYKNNTSSLKNAEAGKLNFTSNINELKRILGD